jgi:uncharacterized protein (DUF983 family)
LSQARCSNCGGSLIVRAGEATCLNCGTKYYMIRRFPDVGDVFVGIVLGAAIIGPLIWTPLGRDFVKSLFGELTKKR